MILRLGDKTPKMGKGCFVAETATVVGDVTMGEQCSVWFSGVVRGDDNYVRIGDRVNIQDCAVIHTSPGESGSALIGSDVVIGHGAIVHGCQVDSHVLIGMGSTILDGAHVGEGSIVAAHALVLGRTQIGPYELWGGVPARFIKKVSPEFVARMIDAGAKEYCRWADVYASGDLERMD